MGQAKSTQNLEQKELRLLLAQEQEKLLEQMSRRKQPLAVQQSGAFGLIPEVVALPGVPGTVDWRSNSQEVAGKPDGSTAGLRTLRRQTISVVYLTGKAAHSKSSR